MKLSPETGWDEYSNSSFDHFHLAPENWPHIWKWGTLARENALLLFPRQAYQELRVDHQLLHQTLVVLSDPSAIRHVCGAGSHNYRLSNLHLRLLRPALGDGLIVAEGKSWLLQRRIGLKLARTASTQEQLQLTIHRIDAMIDAWLSKPCASDGIDPLEDLLALSLDLIAINTFSYAGKVGMQEVLQAITKHRQTIEKTDFFDTLGISPAIGSSKMQKAHCIAHGLDERINTTIEEALSEGHLKGEELPLPENARDFVVSMMAGFESVTMTTLWTLGILAGHQKLIDDIQQQSRPIQELKCPNKTWNHLSLLEKCILESLRLYPPFPLIFRTAVKDDETPAGIIKKGALVCMAPWIVHRHEALWEQPACFIWDRFTNISHLPEAYMPFGMGTRQCVGMQMGWKLVETIIRRLLERCTIQLEDIHLPAPKAGVSLRPQSPLRFLIAKRSGSERTCDNSVLKAIHQ